MQIKVDNLTLFTLMDNVKNLNCADEFISINFLAEVFSHAVCFNYLAYSWMSSFYVPHIDTKLPTSQNVLSTSHQIPENLTIIIGITFLNNADHKITILFKFFISHHE